MRTIQGRLDLLQTAKTGSLKIILLTMIEEEIFIQMGNLKTGNLKKPITAVGIRRKLNRLKMQVFPAIVLIAVSIPYQNPITILIISFQQVVSIAIA